MADEGSSRKRRNRELEEATLGATLSDHVSNGERAERSEVKTSQCDVFRLTIKCQEKNKNICDFYKLKNWYDKKSNRLVAQKQVLRGNKIIVCMILLLFLNGK